ncbi:MAG: OpgC domain-containing protein [Pseudomonadota bacterium]
MASASITSDMGAPGRAAASEAAPSAKVRDPRLDFYRGIAMIIILFAHTPGNFFTSWIPARWGFSDATEIFVFCSGMASAVAFGRTFERAGWTMGTARVSFRVWQVYWAHIAMFFTIAMLMAVLNETQLGPRNYIGQLNLWRFFAEPAPQLIGLFTLTYVPNYFDILPMYLVILAMMPFMIALGRINPLYTFGAMAVLWILAQSALWEWAGAEAVAINFPAEPWSEREWFFNPFGWQLIFFTGFAFMIGWIKPPPVSWGLIALAALIVLANVPLSNIGVRELGFEWAREWRTENRGWFTKSDFGILRYVQFLALAYLFWVAAGAQGARLRPEGQDIASRSWAWIVQIIMKIGQQSLAVFVFSMVFARLIGFTLDVLGRETWTVVALNLIGVASLVGVAYLVAWVKGQPWRPKAKPA